MGRDVTSTSVTPVALFESSSTPLFKIVAGRSGRIGTTAGWDGKRGGEAGRIAYAAPTHRHQAPSFFIVFAPLPPPAPPSSYITFSNSCMDLIMVSSCRKMRGAIGAENNGIKQHSAVKFSLAVWLCVVGVKASWRQQFSKVDSSDKGQYLPPGRLERTPPKSPLRLCFYPFSEKEQRIVIKSEDAFQTEALFFFVFTLIRFSVRHQPEKRRPHAAAGRLPLALGRCTSPSCRRWLSRSQSFPVRLKDQTALGLPARLKVSNLATSILPGSSFSVIPKTNF